MVEMSARVGFGTLVIDNEHGPASIGETIRLVRAAQAAGAQTIVRVGSHARDVLSRTLDTGADGILVPMVNTADEARHVVDICRYAPMGNRGVAGSVVKASGYGTVGDYLTRANGATLLAVQVETATAIANLDEISRSPASTCCSSGRETSRRPWASSATRRHLPWLRASKRQGRRSCAPDVC